MDFVSSSTTVKTRIDVGAPDLVTDYTHMIEKLRAEEKAFSLATVVKINGSASARVGAKAIFDSEGRNIWGWVGGGCAERFVGEQSVEALAERRGRVVLADLDDEIFGLGVACGGTMEIFIDPVLPIEKITLPRHPETEKLAGDLAATYGLRIVWNQHDSSQVQCPESLMLAMAKAAAAVRGRSGRSLRDLKDLPVKFGSIGVASPVKAASLIGRGRIIESLATHFSLLGWTVRIVPPEQADDVSFQKGEAVVIAGHSAKDPLRVARAVAAGAGYIAMVGSRKRALEVIDHLSGPGEEALGFSTENFESAPLYIPAGLDIDARQPTEIALSIVAEVLSELRGTAWI